MRRASRSSIWAIRATRAGPSRTTPAAKEAEAKFGNKIKITRVENVPESADSERVFRDLANKGNKVIFGTSFGYQDFQLKVAKDFPDTMFLTATGFKKAKNFGTTTCACTRARIWRASRRVM